MKINEIIFLYFSFYKKCIVFIDFSFSQLIYRLSLWIFFIKLLQMSLKTEEVLKKGKKEGCEALKIHLPHIQIQHNKYLRTYHALSAELGNLNYLL